MDSPEASAECVEEEEAETLRVLREHLFGMATGGFGNLIATGHTGNFVDALRETDAGGGVV